MARPGLRARGRSAPGRESRAIFLGAPGIGQGLFGASLACLTASLVVSLYEVGVSTVAIELELSDLER